MDILHNINYLLDYEIRSGDAWKVGENDLMDHVAKVPLASISFLQVYKYVH